MQVRDIKRLLDVLGDTDVRELTLETGEYKLNVKRGLDDAVQYVQQAQPQAVNQPAASAPAPAAPAAPVEAAAAGSSADAAGDDRLVDVVAPIVGTFYAAASPDAPPYVSEGQHVKPGTVLCIIEAMKLMNEIEAEVAGVVREILVANDEPVEYGQTLFRIEPD